MEKWPEYNKDGDLPVGVYQATLQEVTEHFGQGNFQLSIIARRLERIYPMSCPNRTGSSVYRFWLFCCNEI